MDRVLSLSQASAMDVSQVGGKALHLAELDAAGFNVPPAFVVTTDAFVEHFQRIGEGALLTSGQAPDSTRLQELREDHLDEGLTRAIDGALRDLAKQVGVDADDLQCAVRSSSADEDSAQASFAGQHATYYYTRRAELPQRILDCWLSCWSSHAASYRSASARGGPRMAVLVQQMVPADVSGVAFTRDPTDPDADTMVVESCWGLGAALVDGRVSPDRHRLTRNGHRVLSKRIGTKRFKVTEDLIDPEGTRLETVARHLQRAEALTPALLDDVVALAAGCEAHYAVPQDVEWAVAGGELMLLQSRPITASAARHPRIDGRWVIFQPIVENFTEALTPLSVDIVRRIVPPFGRFIDGRFYLNLDLLGRLVPLDVSPAQLADLALFRGLDSTPRITRRRLWLPILMALAGYLSWGTLLVRTRHLPSGALAGFKARCAAVLADDRLDALTAARRLFLGVSPLAPAGHLAFQVNVSTVRYFYLLDALRALLSRFAPSFDQSQIGTLCAGSTDMLSTRMIEDLRAVADVAAAEPRVQRLFEEEPPERLAARLAAAPEARTFLREFESFLSTYGHRGTRELEFAAPRWREDPSPLLMMIGTMLSKGRPVNDLSDQRAAAERGLDHALPDAFKRRVARWLIKRIRYYASLRENTRHFHVMGLTTIREKILELERELISAGALRCPDDIFYLTWDELSTLRSGATDWRDASATIRTRRVEHQCSSDRLPPYTFNVEVEPIAEHESDLTGQCASPGVAEGTARVVLDPGTDVGVAPGEILVAPYTDPAWTPLFLNAAAIVVEVGSYLSHAGTVAREYGVPCIVGIDGLMSRLATGQRLRVDATNGRVLILDDAASEAAGS